MSKQLRKGVETLKLFYINQIIQSDPDSTTVEELHSYTLSELDNLFKKIYPSKTKTPYPKNSSKSNPETKN
nr:hypothetical protein [Neobacillus sp. Marseille-Q6967]